MASSLLSKAVRPIKHSSFLSTLRSLNFTSTATATAHDSPSDGASSTSFTFDNNKEQENNSICLKPTASNAKPGAATSSSVTMPMSFMTGSIVGKRFYKKVYTRESDDGVGWSVMLDYRTLKTPSKRPLKLPTLALAKAIAAEWEYQVAHYCNCDLKKLNFLFHCFGIECVDNLVFALAVIICLVVAKTCSNWLSFG